MPLEVIPKVFIGSIHSAFNAESLNHHGVTHILNASRLPITFPKQFTYLSVEIRDRDSSNILACIPTTNIFIEAGIERGGVLVHCFGGKSRSAAFVSAYIMSSMGWSFDEAYNLVKAARPIVEINAGFECQLRAYHAANCDVYLAQQLLLRTRVRALLRQRELNMQVAQNAVHGSNEQHLPPTGPPAVQSTVPVRGLEHSISIESTCSMDTDGGEQEHMQLPVHMHPPNTSTPASTTTGQPKHIRDNHKYDSFTYGSATAYHKETEAKYGHLHIPKLTTQSEEDEAEYTFCKTRSISDVYKHGTDPILDQNNQSSSNEEVPASNYSHGFATNKNRAGKLGSDTLDEDDPHTIALLQQRHYTADSPSNMQHLMNSANNTDTSNSSTNTTGGFSRPRPIGLNINTDTTNSSTYTSGIGFGMNLNISTTVPPTHPPNTNHLNINTSATNPSPLSFLQTAPDNNMIAPDYHSGLTSTALSSSANFMQGSGHHSGNRTHRASAGANRHKNAAGGGGSRGRRTRSSSGDDSHPPACRLSRPGSSVVRVIPPLRGLERQFLCSWCNTSLFTTANVIRTDLDLRALCDAFMISSATALAAATAAANNSLAGQGKFSNGQTREGEEAQLQKLAQQEEQHKQQQKSSMPQFGLQINIDNSAQNFSLSPDEAAKSVTPQHNPFILNAQSMSPVHFASTHILPLISISGSSHNSPVNATTISGSRIGSHGNNNNASKESMGVDHAKKDSGVLPKIALNRSAQNSNNNLPIGILSRTNSGVAVGSNNNVGGMEMDVDSPPKSHYDYDDVAVMTAPKPTLGGPRTHRAAQSKAFDFELPFLDTTTNTITPYQPVKETPPLAAIEESMLENVGIAGSSKKVYHQDDINLGLSSGSAEFDNNEHSGSSNKDQNSTSSSRRNSHLPALLHSKTTITPSTVQEDTMTDSKNSSRRGSGNLNSNNLVPLYTSHSTPTISHTELFPNSTVGNNNAGNPLQRLANLTVSTNHNVPSGNDSNHAGSMHLSQSTPRAEESPRVHIPPHRLQHLPSHTHSSPSNNNTNAVSVTSSVPHPLSHLRPQSAEKRRWLERMNLLRQHSLNTSAHPSGATDTAQFMYSSATEIGNMHSDKVNRMAEADVAASQLIYSGDEKYFHIEYLEWMGTAPLQGAGLNAPGANNNTSNVTQNSNVNINNESGELCCPSCKNVVGGYSWNPSLKMTLGGKLDAPIFKIHKHVVHQMDVQFDATPSSTPRVSDTVMHVD